MGCSEGGATDHLGGVRIQGRLLPTPHATCHCVIPSRSAPSPPTLTQDEENIAAAKNFTPKAGSAPKPTTPRASTPRGSTAGQRSPGGNQSTTTTVHTVMSPEEALASPPPPRPQSCLCQPLRPLSHVMDPDPLSWWQAARCAEVEKQLVVLKDLPRKAQQTREALASGKAQPTEGVKRLPLMRLEEQQSRLAEAEERWQEKGEEQG